MLRFRPHHFLCTLGFVGKGYSADFVRGYRLIADRLRLDPIRGDAETIAIVGRADSIGAPCPSRRGELCESQARIDRLDEAHSRVLGLSDGDEITWGEAKRRIAARMTDDKFEAACAPCSWKALGVCKDALQRLRLAESTEEPNP